MYISVYEHVSVGAHGVHKKPLQPLEWEVQYAPEEQASIGNIPCHFMEVEKHKDVF